MTSTPILSFEKLEQVKFLYLNKQLCIREVALVLKVSPDAVESFIKKHNIPKRGYKEAQQAKFYNKPPSFHKQNIHTPHFKELSAIGTMLYWAEGYKGNERTKTVDFTNSDPLMIQLFLKFLRLIYRPSEKKFRVYLYCYSNQDLGSLIKYWSKITRIPRSQFSKPYVRSDFREDGRKMKYGMIHIRYHDKKLLLDIKSMIESYVKKHAPIV